MRKFALAALVVVVVAGIAVWWFGWLPRLPYMSGDDPRLFVTIDPRLTYEGPFKNIHPGVKYVGDAVCADCHDDVCRTYREHPMGRSLTPITEIKTKDVYTAKNRNPFRALHSIFRVEQVKNTMFHRQTRLDAQGKPIYEFSHDVHYVVGSGSHGESYLSDRSGHLYMSPISFYSQKGIWDLSPGTGFDVIAGDPVAARCLYCHCNHAEPVVGTLNQYQKPIFRGHAIGCERCHGPGELHVSAKDIRKRQLVKTTPFTMADPHQPRRADYNIVNPRHLPPRLRDAVCQQCHLDGQRVVRAGLGLYDFRPGLPLESCWSIFVHATESGQQKKVVNHVEQMHLSRCWQKTAGVHKLGCISCHNPHVKPAPAERAAYFRQKCLLCHAPQRDAVKGRHGPICALPETRRLKHANNCLTCHMPNYQSDENKQLDHETFTDHRILRFKDKESSRHRSFAATDLPIVHFHVGVAAEKKREFQRDVGIALLRQAMEEKRAVPPLLLLRALGLVEQGINDNPTDWPAWDAKATLQSMLNYPDDAIKTFDALLAKKPRWESALYNAAVIHRLKGDLKKAQEYLQRAIEVNHTQPLYHAHFASLLIDAGKWEAAAKHAKTALDLDPESAQTRQLLIRCLHHTGRDAEAKTELNRLQRLVPEQAKQMQQWFDRLR